MFVYILYTATANMICFVDECDEKSTWTFEDEHLSYRKIIGGILAVNFVMPTVKYQTYLFQVVI